jgi:hypothetical protein
MNGRERDLVVVIVTSGRNERTGLLEGGVTSSVRPYPICMQSMFHFPNLKLF